jgi:hypothetical protein
MRYDFGDGKGVAISPAWPSPQPCRDGVGRRHLLMQTEKVSVTPDLAKQLLSQNNGNRNVVQARVDFYASQIAKGLWKLSHQGIAVSKSGRLIDGQHRLAAVIKAGIAIDLMVTTGLPDSVFDVVDTGRARRARDTLSIAGAKSSSTLAAAIKLKLLYERWPGKIWTGEITCSPQEILCEYESHAGLWDRSVAIAESNRMNRILLPPSFAALVFLAASQGVELARLELLALDLKQGSALAPGSPVLAYRNKATSEVNDRHSKVSRTGPAGQRRLAEYIKVLNCCLSATQLKMFKTPHIPPMPRIAADTGVWA